MSRAQPCEHKTQADCTQRSGASSICSSRRFGHETSTYGVRSPQMSSTRSAIEQSDKHSPSACRKLTRARSPIRPGGEDVTPAFGRVSLAIVGGTTGMREEDGGGAVPLTGLAADFEERGWVVVRSVLPPDELADLRRLFNLVIPEI